MDARRLGGLQLGRAIVRIENHTVTQEQEPAQRRSLKIIHTGPALARKENLPARHQIAPLLLRLAIETLNLQNHHAKVRRGSLHTDLLKRNQIILLNLVIHPRREVAQIENWIADQKILRDQVQHQIVDRDTKHHPTILDQISVSLHGSHLQLGPTLIQIQKCTQELVLNVSQRIHQMKQTDLLILRVLVLMTNQDTCNPLLLVNQFLMTRKVQLSQAQTVNHRQNLYLTITTQIGVKLAR